MSNRIVVSCPSCEAKLKLKNRAYLGRRKNCPKCGESFILRQSEKQKTIAASRLIRKKFFPNKQKITILGASSLLVLCLAMGTYAISNSGERIPKNNEELAKKANQTTVETMVRTTNIQNELETQPTPELKLKTPDLSIAETPRLPEHKKQHVLVEGEPVLVQGEPRLATVIQGRESSSRTSEDRKANWPRFRGLNGSGISLEKGLPLEWNTTKNIVWKTELPGPGASSPITWDNHIYLTCYSGYGLLKELPGDQSQLKRHLVCFNPDDGKMLWQKVMPSKSPQFNYQNFITHHGYASSTPAADEIGIYVYYGATGAAAYSHSGELKWHNSCGTRIHNFGTAVSPILHGDLVIIHADVESGSLLALNKKNGHEVWRFFTSIPRGAARSTPVLVSVNGSYELVFHAAANKLAAVDPASGKPLWECRTNIEKYVNPSLVTHDGIIFAIADSPGQAVAVRAGGRGNVTGTHIVWEAGKGCEVVTPIYHNGHLFWVTTQGIAICLDAKNGKVIYQQRLRPSAGVVYASGILVDGKIYYVSREKGTYVLDASPEFKQLAHNIIETDNSVFNGTPAINRGKLLIRSDKYLYCIGRKK